MADDRELRDLSGIRGLLGYNEAGGVVATGGQNECLGGAWSDS